MDDLLVDTGLLTGLTARLTRLEVSQQLLAGVEGKLAVAADIIYNEIGHSFLVRLHVSLQHISPGEHLPTVNTLEPLIVSHQVFS